MHVCICTCIHAYIYIHMHCTIIDQWQVFPLIIMFACMHYLYVCMYYTSTVYAEILKGSKKDFTIHI